MSSSFNFSNCQRNEWISKKLGEPIKLKAYKTGTTIAACAWERGVVLGADTRTSLQEKHGIVKSSLIADKTALKIHYLADNVYACGSGTSADLLHLTRECAAHLKLLDLEMSRPVPVLVAVSFLRRKLFENGGNLEAWFIVGGVDSEGPSLYCIEFDGNTKRVPFAAMGSGQEPALSVYDSDYEAGLSQEECIDQTRRAVLAGITNDKFSGNHVDLCVIRTPDDMGPDAFDVEYYRAVETITGQERMLRYSYPPGATPILESQLSWSSTMNDAAEPFRERVPPQTKA